MKCPSGLRSTPGKCVYRKLYREFESLLHRHILQTQTPDFPRESRGLWFWRLEIHKARGRSRNKHAPCRSELARDDGHTSNIKVTDPPLLRASTLPQWPYYQTASGNLTAASGKSFLAQVVKVLLEEHLIHCTAVREHHDHMDEFGLARPGSCTVFSVFNQQRLGFGKRSTCQYGSGPPGVHELAARQRHSVRSAGAQRRMDRDRIKPRIGCV